MKLYLHRWAAKMTRKNKLDGLQEHFIFKDYSPALFFTKKETLAFIKKGYGYLKDRKDLRQEPFGWRMPKPVKVKILVEER